MNGFKGIKDKALSKPGSCEVVKFQSCVGFWVIDDFDRKSIRNLHETLRPTMDRL
jgi:hypothetical protein